MTFYEKQDEIERTSSRDSNLILVWPSTRVNNAISIFSGANFTSNVLPNTFMDSFLADAKSVTSLYSCLSRAIAGYKNK